MKSGTFHCIKGNLGTKAIIFLFISFLLVSFIPAVHAETIYLRPNATIKEANNLFGCAAGWDCIDEVTSDDSTTTVALTATTTDPMFDLNDTKNYISGGIPNGARIDWAMGTIRGRDTAGAGNNRLWPMINVSNSANGQRSIYNGSTTNNPGATWADVSTTNYTTNPKTGAAWVLSEIDGLRIGFDSSDVAPVPNVTQAYVSVGYTPVITANASFDSAGATNTVLLGQSFVFNGTCDVNGGTATTVELYIQDNSTGSFANTSGSTSADIYVNRTVYNISSLSGTSGSMFFNVTVKNTAAFYSMRVQCQADNVVPSWANSTVETNLTVNLPALTANASFGSSGALATLTVLQSIIYNGTCTSNGDALSTTIEIQDNRTDGNFKASSTTASDPLYVNVTSYSLGTLAGASGNMFFNVSTNTPAAEYGIRLQCNSTTAAPSSANSTVQTNLSVSGQADTCTPAANEDWVLNCADNCQLHNKHYAVKRINATGTGNILFSSSTINYTAFSLEKACRFMFNGSFVFRRQQPA